ncbi:hypothetical protein [Spirosoma sp. KNUC1025]|uniref:hypothetical protein n=1 Tax=Spirosoma sp. KNUC1025 TaxID=2894082 RepID=UPI003864FFC4|nr:hypothetical protein LN737_06760 [Spirosoma sp. KNUC1025]
MPLFAFINRRFRSFVCLFILVITLFVSALSIAQLNLTYRLLNGYLLSDDAPVNKGKPTLFVFEQADTFSQVFKPATTGTRKPDVANFSKDMVIGVTLPATNKPPRLSISKVFVQDSTLTIRYIRLTDTTFTHNPQSFTTQPMLLVAVPKQTVLRTRLVENGKVIQTLKKRKASNVRLFSDIKNP